MSATAALSLDWDCYFDILLRMPVRPKRDPDYAPPKEAHGVPFSTDPAFDKAVDGRLCALDVAGHVVYGRPISRITHASALDCFKENAGFVDAALFIGFCSSLGNAHLPAQAHGIRSFAIGASGPPLPIQFLRRGIAAGTPEFVVSIGSESSYHHAYGFVWFERER